MADKQHQIDELVLLECMYPDEFAWKIPSGADIEASELDEVNVTFLMRIKSYTLEITLPAAYPVGAKPQAYLHCDDIVPTAARKEARAALQLVIDDTEMGVECLDIVIQDLTTRLDSVNDPASLEVGATQTQEQKTAQSPTSPSRTIKRLLLWSHHLLATSKRKDIVSWSRELSLSGFSRPGHPGAVVIEGEEQDVDDFEMRIKALRWQALQTRGEETSDHRLLVNSDRTGIGMTEVQDLSDIVQGLRQCQDRLGDWFLSGMKIGHG